MSGTSLGAFGRPPSMAQQFAQQYAGSAAGQTDATTQQPQPEPQPEPMTVTVPPARTRNTILPQSQSAATQQPPVAPPSQGGETVTPDVPSAPSSPPVLDVALQRQLEEERKAFAVREQQWNAAYKAQQEQLAQMQDISQRLAQYEQRAELQKKFADDKLFENLETVDPSDARRLIEMTADVLHQPLQEAREQLAQERKVMDDQLRQTQLYAQQQAQAVQAARIRDQLLAAHPDFFHLYEHDPKFKEYLGERDGLHSYSREDAAIAEYNAGNVAYLIDMINKYKGRQPQNTTIQTPAPVQVANAAPQPDTQPAPQFTLADLNMMMHTGRINQDQYRMELNKLRAMQPQPA